MSPRELEIFLHDQIPIAKSFGLKVEAADADKASVSAPLAANRNHLGTAFGGSLGAMLIFSGYTWLYHAMATRGHRVHVILQKCETDYRRPVDADLAATAYAPEAKDLAIFLQAFDAKGTARVWLRAEIRIGSEVACAFKGLFVAKLAESSRLT